MKKLTKILIPVTTLVSTGAIIAPLASCSCGKTEDQTVKLTLAPESSSCIKVKESKLALNTDSTITLEVPNTKGIKVTYILVGTTRLEASAYSVEDNVITIKAAAMKEKNVELCVYAQDVVGLAAKTKTFEALETFKASDLTVNKVYEDKSVSKPLTWNTDYKIYDSADKEITDFDTVGYTFTRADARTSPVLFTIEFVHNDSITTDLNVNVEPLMEPESITVDVEGVVFGTTTIYPKDLNVNAIMAKDKSTKTLEYGEYFVYDENDQLIENFDKQGYKLDGEGSHTLTVKTNVPDVTAPISLIVEPEQYKNTVFLYNDDTVDASVVLSNLEGTFKYSNKKDEWIGFKKGDLLKCPAKGFLAIEGKKTDGTKTISIETSSKTPNIKLYGNALGLLDDGKGEAELTSFASLFEGCTAITYVAKNFLPSKTLTELCYDNMFADCTNLITAPDLPAETLTLGCYTGMFAGCTKLVNAPDLPAKTLTRQCYYDMFYECTSLIIPPKMSIETTAESCCESMFCGCKNLKTAPDLEAEVIDKRSYHTMFGGCTSLVNPPQIKAKTLGEGCFASMFYGCTSLTSTPELLAETLTNGCYLNMFTNCSSLTSISKIYAKSLFNYSCNEMFLGCGKLKINNTGISGTLFFTCPDLTGLEGSVTDMFTKTGGSYTKDPIAGESYYFD